MHPGVPARTAARLLVLLSSVGLVWAASLPVTAAETGSPVEATQAAEPAFFLAELRVLGSNELDVRVVEQVLTPFLGPDKTLADVELARVALEERYHAAGFGTVYVDIPEQTIGDDGVVRLRVTESRIARLTLSGTRYFSNRQIRAALPQAQPGTLPSLPELQSQISAVNETTPDRTVVPVLKAGRDPGTVDLELKVDDKLPLHVSVEVNDQYAADTSHLRSLVAFSYDNMFGRADSAALQYQAAPANTQEVGVFAATYTARLSSGEGPVDKLILTIINSSSNVATLGDINVLGAGQTYGARYLHTLSRTPELQSALSVAAEFKKSTQDVRLDAKNGVSTPLSYATAQLAYSLSLVAPTRYWSGDLSVTTGLSGLGSNLDDFANKCFRCRPNFMVLRSNAALRQKLPLGLSASLQVGGQYSVDPLTSSEQSLIGGARTVRGYLEAAELGDIGAHASIELRKTWLLGPNGRFRVEPFLFFDAGTVRFQAPLPGRAASASLHSLGFGMDLAAWGILNLSINVADPLNDSGQTLSGQPRVGFVMRTAW